MAYTRHSLPVNTVNNETHYISHKDSYCSRNRWGGHTETTNQKTDYISSQHYNLLFVEGMGTGMV